MYRERDLYPRVNLLYITFYGEIINDYASHAHMKSARRKIFCTWAIVVVNRSHGSFDREEDRDVGGVVVIVQSNKTPRQIQIDNIIAIP